ncbi:MAG: hypothetical protein SGPRY_011141, partial [Prymnesium sp.]
SEGTGMLAADGWIEMWDFGETSAESEWREVLASDRRVVVMQGNLLVEPSVSMGHAFEQSFRPSEALAAQLDRQSNHRLVAHLRVADGEGSRGLAASVQISTMGCASAYCYCQIDLF